MAKKKKAPVTDPEVVLRAAHSSIDSADEYILITRKKGKNDVQLKATPTHAVDMLETLFDTFPMIPDRIYEQEAEDKKKAE